MDSWPILKIRIACVKVGGHKACYCLDFRKSIKVQLLSERSAANRSCTFKMVLLVMLVKNIAQKISMFACHGFTCFPFGKGMYFISLQTSLAINKRVKEDKLQFYFS